MKKNDKVKIKDSVTIEQLYEFEKVCQRDFEKLKEECSIISLYNSSITGEPMAIVFSRKIFEAPFNAISIKQEHLEKI